MTHVEVGVKGRAGGPRVVHGLDPGSKNQTPFFSPFQDLGPGGKSTNETPERPKAAAFAQPNPRNNGAYFKTWSVVRPPRSARPLSAVPWLPQSASRNRGVTDGVAGGWGCLGPWFRPGCAQKNRRTHAVHVVSRCCGAALAGQGRGCAKRTDPRVFLRLRTGYGIQQHRAVRRSSSSKRRDAVVR